MKDRKRETNRYTAAGGYSCLRPILSESTNMKEIIYDVKRAVVAREAARLSAGMLSVLYAVKTK